MKNLQTADNVLIARHEDFTVYPILTTFDSPPAHFKLGQKLTGQLDPGQNYALIASGDLSHVLREDGPYGFNADGPKFDRELAGFLQAENISDILKLDNKYPQAADCGLRSFAFCFGILDSAGIKLKPKILSYEGPFGVGYLVAKLS